MEEWKFIKKDQWLQHIIEEELNTGARNSWEGNLENEEGGLEKQMVCDPGQPAFLPQRPLSPLSGFDWRRPYTLGSSRTFGSLFHLSWDCLWFCWSPQAVIVIVVWRACYFPRIVLEVKDLRTKGNLWGTELCLLGTCRQFVELIPEAIYMYNFFHGFFL